MFCTSNMKTNKKAFFDEVALRVLLIREFVKAQAETTQMHLYPRSLFGQMKWDFIISPLSTRTSSPVMLLFTTARK